ncbi:hypothetical protein PLESTB_000470400 [Pleodorina starrii]|uniref:Uncharacterized protein n=1 Tax=Pleodorina starrii TaxID=330485 RepID=A0A9W6BGD8_9CHLO|nr:hypothetical protein PLESTM_001596500 [Pleodorina starrii]GLC51142.1 hypothetical protein PLESTB_000470400 [Pleodorina starrii]GLC63499.1 hypothetical protein PLESTF_000042800 [Pleodorina starrii]
MPFIRGIIFSSGLLDGCQALRDQLPLLHWGGLQLAVLQNDAGSLPPAAAAAVCPQQPPAPHSGPTSLRYGCEGVTVLQLSPAAAGAGPSVAAAAEAAAASWAVARGLQWPGEVLVTGLAASPEDVAGALRRRLREQQQPEAGRGEGRGGGEEGVLPGFELQGAEAAQAAPWQRLRLALAHANLRRATAAAGSGLGLAPPLVVVGTAMKPSRERDLAREGLLNLVPMDGVVFAPLDLAHPLESQLPFHAVLHKASDELELGPGAGAEADPRGGGGGGGGGGGVPRFGPRVRALADFAGAHPEISLVDPLEAAGKVINRTELARVCDSLSSLDLDPDLGIGSGADAGVAGSGTGDAAADEGDAPADEDEDEGEGGGGGEAADVGRAKRRRVGASAAAGRAAGVARVRVRVRAPRSTTVASFSREELEAAAARLGCPPPYIVKPVVACGTPDSHSMALVLLPLQQAAEGLTGLPLPAVVQEFVNHDATIFKVYVAGDKVFHTVRPSIPNVPRDLTAALQLAPAGVLRFDSLKSLPTSLRPQLPVPQDQGQGPSAAVPGPASAHSPAAALVTAPPPARGPPTPAPQPSPIPSQAALERLVAHLRTELGLSLFGFDVVIATEPGAAVGGGSSGDAAECTEGRAGGAGGGGSGGEEGGPEQQQGGGGGGGGGGGQVRGEPGDQELVVVDVNYFPSYRGAEGAPGLFRAAVRGTYERQQRERQQRGGQEQQQWQ